MKVFDFLEVFQNNRDKELIFEYKKNTFIGANYHLTEIKNVDFSTVDYCGGKKNT